MDHIARNAKRILKIANVNLKTMHMQIDAPKGDEQEDEEDLQRG